MNFEEKINELESIVCDEELIIRKGSIPILFSAPHDVKHHFENGNVKKCEPYTKAISLFLNKYCDTYAIVKMNDTGLDSNRNNHDKYKEELINLVKDNDIKLVIDLHGASIGRDFDVEFGTLNNLSADFSTINELKESFIENGIVNINMNDPFKGGAITQYLYNLRKIDVIQLEINGKYRDYNNLELLQQFIKALNDFINHYMSVINK